MHYRDIAYRRAIFIQNVTLSQRKREKKNLCITNSTTNLTFNPLTHPIKRLTVLIIVTQSPRLDKRFLVQQPSLFSIGS